MNAPDLQESRQPFWFLLLLALAVSGGAIAYVPFLTVLLPLKVTALVGTDDVPSLARATFYGAIIASLANIAFGMASDRSKMRLPWILAGLVGSNALLLLISQTTSLFDLIVLIMAWQIALNMMLAPLLAWAGDCVPDSQKGLLGGLLSIAPALGAMAASLVTFESVVPENYRMTTVAFLVALFILPLAIFGRGRERAELMRSDPAAARSDDEQKQSRTQVNRMWLARFLVQVAEAGMFAFLLFWLRSLSPGLHENFSANLFSLVLLLSVPLSLLTGRWSDSRGRPMLPLALMGAICSIGLVVMALADALPLGIAGFFIFGTAASIFLSLHTSQTMRVLPKPEHRGRDLGMFNLTNTIPSIVMPWLTLALVPEFGFSGLFLVFAGLAMLAAVLLRLLPKTVRKA